MKISRTVAEGFAKELVRSLSQGEAHEMFWREIEDTINAEIEKSEARIVFKDGKLFAEFYFGEAPCRLAYAPLGIDPWGPMDEIDEGEGKDPAYYRSEAASLDALISTLRSRKVECDAAAQLLEAR